MVPQKRLGNPAASAVVNIIFVSQTHRPPTPNPPPFVPAPSVDPNPMPWKTPGGEDVKIQLSADKSQYGWDEEAILKAKVIFASDGAIATGKALWFVIASRNIVGGYETRVIKTDDQGVATLYLAPWGLPDDPRQGMGYSIVAKFDGY